ncbi:MAG: hypothetical protein ACLFUP_09390 [Desulfobacteraceae bacterium]
MKIRVNDDQIVKAVKKLEGIELVVEGEEDALEGIRLILRKPEHVGTDRFNRLKDIKVSTSLGYDTSAVEYRMRFILEFIFEDDVPLDERVEAIKAFQSLLERV